MLKKSEIIACLNENKSVSGYELKITNKESRELFYVLKHLEINRAVNIDTYVAEIYVSTSKTTGSSSIVITPADDVKSLKAKIKAAVKKAKAGKNQYYPLAPKTKNIKEAKPEALALNDIASKVAEAVFKADVYTEGWINSTEIFVTSLRKEFYNSNKVHHVTNGFLINLEVIPTWSNKKEEFELYKFFETGSIDYERITTEVEDILTLAKERSVAKTLKDVKLPDNLTVLVEGEMIGVIVDQLSSELGYATQFMKSSHYSLGDTVSNTAFSVIMKPEVEGASKSSKIDGNGIVLKEKTIIENGKAVSLYGSLRFGTYMKEKEISGVIPVCTIEAERSEYKDKPYLLITHFSSPQLEEASGYWGGEVRLARYFDGKKFIPLTGFSVSGNLYEDLKDIRFSKEDTVLTDYSGPKYFIFDNISIH